jgi:antitoxin component YwqK of YwqJK toxin-antitoxin module
LVMKPTLIISFLLTASTCLAQKRNVYFFKNGGVEVQTRDSADVIRIVTEPDTGATNFKVLEYYKNGKAKFAGESSTVEPLMLEGSAIFYFPNGKRSAIEQFDHGIKKVSSTYYPNGKPQAIREYPKALADSNKYKNFTVTDYNDTTGKAQVVDGNGDFAGFEIEMNDRYAEGKIVNGKKEGTWKGSYPADKITFIEEYHDGNLLTGTCITAKNKKYTYHTEVALLNVGYPDGPTWELAELSSFVPDQASTSTSERIPVITTRLVGVPAGTRPAFSGSNMSSASGLGVPAPNIANLQEHGVIIVSFTIDKNGRTTDLKIRKSLNEDQDKIALKLATEIIEKKTGNKPAILLGKPIETRYTLPIKF